MNRLQTFEQFLATTSAQVPAATFFINLLLAAMLSFVLGHIYVRYGSSLSNRKMFARNFLIMTLTTVMIISIVKSSLALSLGLVGALSIVRFRAAIKEPEELSYLFLAIGIGLGFGADQRIVTIIAFFVIATIIIAVRGNSRKQEDQNLYLTVKSNNPNKIELEDIINTLKRHCTGVNLKRFDETEEILEALFLVEFRNFEQLNITKHALQRLNDSLNISLLDNRGLV